MLRPIRRIGSGLGLVSNELLAYVLRVIFRDFDTFLQVTCFSTGFRCGMFDSSPRLLVGRPRCCVKKHSLYYVDKSHVHVRSHGLGKLRMFTTSSRKDDIRIAHDLLRILKESYQEPPHDRGFDEVLRCIAFVTSSCLQQTRFLQRSWGKSVVGWKLGIRGWFPLKRTNSARLAI